VLRWSCVFCGHINQHSVKPGTIRIQCKSCERHWFYGLAFHIPMNSSTKLPKDNTIPVWADDEYVFDTIPDRLRESMEAVFHDPNRKIPQRGRVHVIILHDSLYYAEPEPTT
jgi:hypothetical protein